MKNPVSGRWGQCLAMLALAGCAAGTGAPATMSAGVTSARSHYAPTLELARRMVRPALAFVTYHGGPVLVDPKIYLVFWGYKTYGDPDGVEKLLTSYTQAMGGSPHNNIYTQYYQIVSSQKIYITNPKMQFGGAWNDDAAVPKNPSDQEIAAEAVKSLAQFGYDPNGLYVVATPHKHSEAGFGEHWCSYHSYTYTNSDQVLAYSNLPYMPDAGKTCGNGIIKPPHDESAVDEGVTILAGHEYGEAITDPQPFTAWNGVSGEIGDYCAWQHIANVRFGKSSYTTQPMLSNKTESCVQEFK